MPRQKSDTVRQSVPLERETDEAFKELAAEWGVSVTDVLKLMVSRGVTIEVARRKGYDVQFKHPDEKEPILLPDDRPVKQKQIPFGPSDLSKLIESPNGREGGS